MIYYPLQPKPEKRKVFISFRHKNEQPWFDYFSKKFGDQYEVFYDQSLNTQLVRSDDPEYINRAIREDYIKGSSVTIVLCGAETQKRKYVDWEIYSTLHYEHALLGIALPNAQRTQDGKIIVPDRLYANWATGYAHFIEWTDDPLELKRQIEIAIQKSTQKNLVDNSQEKMERNLA